jgi:uncharacterized damage-inducible protein DinB
MNRQRQQLVKRLEQSGAEYITYLSQLSADEVTAKPSPADWSIHQVAAHMRDTEQMAFLVRAERFLKETQPTFANFDQDEYWRNHPYSPDEPLKKIIADFRTLRRKLVRLLRRAPDKVWQNYGMHSAYGKVSLDWVAMHCYHHTLEHIAQIGYAREKELLKELNR